MAAGCPLCVADGGEVVLRTARWRIVLPDEPGYPGFTRVIWNAHVAEMTDLPASHRAALMETVFAVEALQRELLAPDKVNLASLGNMVPHLHWHVIPRWRDDPHFPAAVWAAAAAGRESAAAVRAAAARERLPEYRSRLAALAG